MVYSYRRQVPGFAPLATQQHDIITFVHEKEMIIDKEVVEYATKNLFIDQRKEFEAFLRSMVKGNVVIVSSLGILSDRTEEVIKVITCMLTHEVNLYITSSDMLINKDTNMVDIFPFLNELNKESKEKNTSMGRPKGSKSSSKFDVYHSQIIAFMAEGMSVSAVSRELKVSRSSLKDYIKSRGIKELVQGAGYLSENARSKGMDNILLICPFEEKYKAQLGKKDKQAKKAL
jgi:DNA invertase Pin-like site-specific DNA recombinase